ncbi:hypothetical protein Tco_0400510 [Tanacetum coccineum]
MDGVFPINISRPLNGVKLLGGSVSLDEGFCRDLALKRVSKTISLVEAIHKLYDPRIGTLADYRFFLLASRLQTSALQAKILVKTGIESQGSLCRELQWRIVWTKGDIIAVHCSNSEEGAPMGFLSDDGKDLRPADLLLFNWLQGKDACLDVTCISPFAGMGRLLGLLG